ncbi:MAG: hypothetical protein DWQ48_07420, partial [Bacteroidetes bacterium]
MKNHNYLGYLINLMSGKKNQILLAAGLFFTLSSAGQMNYTLSRFSGTYTPVSGGAIQIVSGAGTNQFSTSGGVANANDGAAYITLPFNFTYAGVSYTGGVHYIGVSTNGFVYPSTVNTNASKITTATNNLSSGTTPMIAPWWDDLTIATAVNGFTGQVKYETTGSAPDRVLTIEYTDVPAYASGNVKALNFQVKIYENGHTTKSNHVEFWYGQVKNTGTVTDQFNVAETASIGVKNSTGGFGQFMDAITGSGQMTISFLNSNKFPVRHVRFVPGAPTALAGGTYTVGPTGTYPSLTAAIADLNQRGISGAVTFSLIDALYDTSASGGSNTFPILLGPVVGTSSTNTITIESALSTSTLSYRGNTSTSGNLITPASATHLTVSSEPIIGLVGTDYVTLNKLTLTQATGAGNHLMTVKRGLQLTNATLTDGATNNTIKNITAIMGKSNLSTTITAIHSSISGTISSAAGANSFNKFLDLNIVSASASGIELVGNATHADDGNHIGSSSPTIFSLIGSPTDTIGGLASVAAQGIAATSQKNIKIYNNHVRNVISLSTMDGIFLSLGQGICEIYNNKVENIRNFSTTSTTIVTGIKASLATTTTHECRIYNNFVSKITHGYTGTASATRTARGIMAPFTTGGPGNTMRVEFNSVRMENDPGFTASSSCFEIAGVAGNTVIARNNIFADFSPAQSGVARHHAWYSTTVGSVGNSGSLSNYNDLYVADLTNGFVGAAGTTGYATLNDWQTATSQDANSISVAPGFTNPTDLHASSASLNSAADPAYTTNTPWVTVDIDNQTRNNPTDIGADEFTPSATDMGAVALLSPSPAGCFTNNQNVIVRIRNFGTIPIDFSTDNTTITVDVTNAVTQTISLTLTDNSLNPGGTPLGAGATMDVNIGTLNMSTIGSYNYDVYTTVAGDGNSSNDAVSPAPASVVLAVQAGTASSNIPSICTSGGPVLTLSGHIAGSSIQWKSATTTGGPYSNIGTGTPFTAPNITDTTYYIAEVTCNGIAQSNEVMVEYLNPQVSSVTGGTRCGSGSVQLSATTSSGGLSWYAAQTGGVVLDTGSVFNTPVISTTTSFWVAANDGGSVESGGKTEASAGTSGTTASTYGLVFNTTKEIIIDSVTIILNTAAGGTLVMELRDSLSGSTGPGTFVRASKSISVPTGVIGQRVRIHVGFVVPPGNNYRLLAISSPSLIRTSSGNTYPYISSGGTVTIWSGFITNSGSASYYYFYDWRIISGCEGARTEVVATITTPPSINASASQDTICTGQSTNLSVSSANPNYTYSWTSSPAGFSATGAGPHAVSPTSNTTYNVTASDTLSGSPDSGCVTNSNVAVAVNPVPIAPTITPSNPISICSGQSVQLVANLTAPPSQFTVGTQTTTIGGSNGNPYRSGNGAGNQIKTQLIYTAAELSAAGLTAGYLVGGGFTVTNVSASTISMDDWSFKIGSTTATSLTTNFETSPLTTVHTQATGFHPPVGVNIHPFSTPFFWNGTSNILVETCQKNVVTGTHTVAAYTPGFTSNLQAFGSATSCTNPTGSTVTTKPIITFQRLNSVTGVVDWTSIPAGFTATDDTINTGALTSNTTFIATFTDGNGCSNSSSKLITVNQIPLVYNVTGGGTRCSNDPNLSIDLSGSETGVNYQLVLNGTTNIGSALAGTGSALNFGNFSGPGTYTVVASTGTSPVCTSNMSGSAVINVNPAPTATVSGGGTVCDYQANPDVIITLTGTSPWDVTYYDGSNSTTVTGVSSSPLVLTNPPAGTYTVTNVTGALGCSNVGTGSATVTVITTQAVSVSISGTNTICDGANTTFTATPVNGGATPIYQWQVNGTNVGTNSDTYSSSTLADNDVVTCILTSSLTCTSGSPATSNAITMSVIPNSAVSVSISTATSTVCENDPITFTATPTNGGVSPSYQWKVNGTNVGTNSDTYVTSTLVDGDIITCELNSSIFCTTGNPATSNSITMTVNPSQNVSVSITADPSNNSCVGETVAFLAVPVNGGSSPSYQWQVNGTNVGTNSALYVTSSLNDQDIVTCILTSNITPCPVGSPATSNAITMNVSNAVPVSVTITADTTTICDGGSVTFTAHPVNEGTSPFYNWQVNGVDANVFDPTFTTTSLQNGDIVTVILESSLGCGTNNPDTSNAIAVTVNPNLPVSVTIGASANPVCFGANVTFTAIPTNGGSSPSYQWQVNGTNVGTNSNTYSTSSLNNGDLVTCILSSSEDCKSGNPATSNTITMSILSLPNANINPDGPTQFCVGGNVTLLAEPGLTYSWSPGGQTTQSITVSTTGLYTLTVTDANNCSNVNSTNVIAADYPTVSISGNSVICGNGVAILNANATPGTGSITNYQWVLNGTTNVGTNSSSHNANVPGTYTVIVTNQFGCSTTSPTFEVSSDNGPLTGTYTVGNGPTTCSNFQTIGTAISALNTRGIAGHVVFDVIAGHVETTPSGGYSLNQCGLSAALKSNASQTITFQKSGSGANPKLLAGTGIGTADFVFALVGADYVTIDQIDIEANPANTTGTTRVEFGYLLVKCSDTDGAQNNLIKNCNITLNKANVNQTLGIYSVSSNDLLIPIGASSAEGTNSNNRFYGNNISNVLIGIFVSGFADTTPFTHYDQNNEIGAAGMGNNITNFGGAGTASLAAYGIITQFQNNQKIIANTVNSTGGGQTAIMNGIRASDASNANTDIIGNTVTIASGPNPTGQMIAIINTSGSRAGRPSSASVNNVVNIKNNTIQNSSYQTNPSTTSDMWLLFSGKATADSLGAAKVVIEGNQLVNNTSTSNNTGTMFCIIQQVAIDSAFISNNNISNNTINGNVAYNLRGIVTGWAGVPAYKQYINVSGNTVNGNAMTTQTTGLFDGIVAETYTGASPVSGTTLVMQNNTVGNMTVAAQTTGAFTGISTTSSTNIAVDISGNTVTNVTRNLATTGAFNGIRSTGTANVSAIMNNNTLSNISMTGATTSVINGITHGGSSTLTTTVSMNGNQVSGCVFNGSGTATLLDANLGVNITMNNNTVTNNQKTGSGIMYCSKSGTSQVTFSGNTITNNSIPSLTGALVGTLYGYANIGSPTAENVTNNVVSNLSIGGTTTGTTSLVSGIHGSTTAASAKVVSGNTIHSISSAVAGTVYGISSGLATGVNISRNKIYNLSSSSNSATVSVYGIHLISGGGNIFNNMIGNLTAPDAASLDAIRGISSASTSTANIGVFNNTVYLSGTSSAANFGTSGIYHTTSATATVAALDMRNNIVINLSTPKGTGKASAYRRSSTTLTNFAAANFNIFYAGAPSANNVIFFDGTNFDQTLSAYKTRVAPRDAGSYTENCIFQSTVGSNANFLKLSTTNATVAEGNAQVISSPAITVDFFGTTRSTTTPDIGAHEDVFLGVSPEITNVSINPAGNQCTAQGRTVTATVTSPGSVAFASINLFYTVNNGAPVSVPMTLVSGSVYNGTIPASGSSTISWYITATDVNGFSKTSPVGTYQDAYLSVTANATPTTVCTGSTVALSASSPTFASRLRITEIVQFRTGSGSTNPYPSWVGAGDDLLEITNLSNGAQLTNGITMEMYTSTTLNRSFTLPSFSIPSTGVIVLHLGTGTDDPANNFYNTGGTSNSLSSGGQVGFLLRNSSGQIIDAVATNGYTFPAAAGVTPADWSGTMTSNSSRAGSSLTIADNNNASNWVASNTGGPIQTVGTHDPGIALIPASTSLSVTWSDGGSFSATGVNVTSDPVTGPTTYTVTLSDGTCSTTSTVSVTTITSPAPPSSVNNSTQCGPGIPTASVSGTGSPRWYNAQTGGTLLQAGGTSYGASISTTTSFWVAMSDGTCESARLEVIATVTSADPVNLTATPASICLGGSATLNASSVNTNYQYSWTGQPNSGMVTANGASVSVTPTATGTFTYDLFASDPSPGGCSTTGQLTLTVLTTPPQVNAGSDQLICSGTNATLIASTGGGPSGSFTVGTATTTIGGNDGNPYRSGNGTGNQIRTQLLYTASELSAAGLTAGNLTSIGFTTTSVGGTVINFVVKIGTTTVTSLGTTFETSPMMTVNNTASFTAVVGLNTHNFTTPFFWNGTSNLLIETCQENSITGTNTVSAYTPAFVSNTHRASSSTSCTDLTGTSVSNKPIITIGRQVAASGNVTWTSIPSGFTASGDTVSLGPVTAPTYFVAQNSNGACSTSDTVFVDVTPTLPAPTATNSSQCGAGVPPCSVSTNGFLHNWYLSPTGGTPIPGETGPTLGTYSISATTNFYVTEFDGVCESPRSLVTATVTLPDSVTATVSSNSICIGSSVDLDVIYTGTNNTYTYSWTASPEAGSGITGSVAGQMLNVTPTNPGTYVYTVLAFDAGQNCSETSNITVVVHPFPSAVNAGVDQVICTGGSTTLSSSSSDISSTLRLTEISQFITSNGAQPSFPAYMGITAGSQLDYIEITNLGSGPEAMGGAILEVWTTSTTAPHRSFSLPYVSAPSGQTIILHLGSSKPDSPANFFWGTGGADDAYGSATAVGYIIRKGGQIVDAVGVNSYVFPAASGVTTSHWSGNIASMSGRAGSRLKAADNNTAANWEVTLTPSILTSFGTINSGVTANLPASSTVSWSTVPPSAFNPVGSSVTTDPLSATTVFVATLTSAAGCSVTDTMVVDVTAVPPTPLITASTDTLCNSGIITLIHTNYSSGAVNQWQISSDGTNFTDISGANGQIYISPVISNNTYYRLKSSCSDSSFSATRFVFVKKPLVASSTGATRCGPGPVTLSVTGNGVFNWYSQATGGTLLFTGPVYNINLSNTATFYVEAVDGTCINAGGRTAVTAIINTSPSVSLAITPDATICQGSSVTITASSTNDPNYTYHWSLDQTTVFATGASQVLSPNANTTYYIYAVDSSNGSFHGCAFLVAQGIVVNPTPAAPVITPNPAYICDAGGVANLLVSNPSSGVQYTWSPGGSTGTSLTVSPSSTTTYTITAQLIQTSNNLALTAVATSSGGGANQYGPASLNNNAFGNCDTTVWAWVSTNGNYTYTWSSLQDVNKIVFFKGNRPATTMTSIEYSTNGGSTWNTLLTSVSLPSTSCVAGTLYDRTDSVTFPVISVNALRFNGIAGASNPNFREITVHGPSVSTNCISQGTVTVEVDPVTVPVITPSGPTTFCPGGSVTLDAGAGYTTYSWSDGSNVVGNGQTLVASPSASTTYTVTVSNGGFCTKSASLTVNVHVVTAPVITSDMPGICLGQETATLTLNTSYASYLWSPGGETAASITVNTGGTYSVSVVDANGCSGNASINIAGKFVPPVPSVTPVGPINLCWDGSTDATAVLSVDTSGAGPGASVIWNDLFVSSDDNITVFSSLVFSPFDQLNATVTSGDGCSVTSNT